MKEDSRPEILECSIPSSGDDGFLDLFALTCYGTV